MICNECNRTIEPGYECDGGICWGCHEKKEAREFVQSRIEGENFNAAETLDELTTFFDGDPSDLF